MYSHRYPRPQLERQNWKNLNGTWQFAIDIDATWEYPHQVTWNQEIVVPFAPETAASGINNTSLYKSCWYKRAIATPELTAGESLVLHFGAVDWKASVWVNGQLAASHDGGYTPFSVEITELLVAGGEQIIVVRAEDDPLDMAKPRGKQDWLEDAHSIWYPRTTGIWQTVWIEKLGLHSIKSLQWTSDIADWEIGMLVEIEGPKHKGLTLAVRLSLKDELLVDDVYRLKGGALQRQIRLPDPGLDAARDSFLWSPESPTLISAELTLSSEDGTIIDTVKSYTAMRSVEIDHQRFLLNGSHII